MDGDAMLELLLALMDHPRWYEKLNILDRGGRRFSVRPERIQLDGAGDPATIADVVFVGSFTRYLVDTEQGERLTVVRQNDGTTLEPGTRVHVAWRDDDVVEIPGPPEPPGPPGPQGIRHLTPELQPE